METCHMHQFHSKVIQLHTKCNCTLAEIKLQSQWSKEVCKISYQRLTKFCIIIPLELTLNFIYDNPNKKTTELLSFLAIKLEKTPSISSAKLVLPYNDLSTKYLLFSLPPTGFLFKFQ